ncbi:MAG: FAD-binding oxidoreductase [Proteobacteria bacterium]|nr:FAD-binding oxidoreductase [Pseudomonadota bacterium]
MAARAGSPATDPAQASGWYAVLPEPPPAKRLMGEQTADYVVAGAGFTGLAAARRLGELAPDKRIILLESHRVGYGASGRNSGFIIDAPCYTPDHDADYNHRMMRLLRAGHGQLKELIRAHDIACGWSQVGHLCAVAATGRIPLLEGICRSLDAVGDDYDWLEGAAIEAATGTPYYSAAIRLPRTILMNPAALCRGLGETLPANVEVYEDSPVRRITPGETVRIECAEGSITAKSLLLATNAATPALGFLKRRLMPMLLYASLSKPLSEAQAAAMSGAPAWGLTPKAAMGSTIRRVGDRMAIRNVVRHSADFHIDRGLKARLRQTHRELLAKRFPMLAELEMEHSWGGVIAMTENYSSVFGRLEPGVFASVGYNGVGLARGTASGAALAEYVLGGDSELISDIKALAGPGRFPPRPFLDIGVAASLAWKSLRVGIDR